MINIFWYDLKLWSFFKIKHKFSLFWKFIYIQQQLKYNIWCITGTLGIFDNNLQKTPFKNSFLWKLFLGINPFILSLKVYIKILQKN
jgi:hypothetical protein